MRQSYVILVCALWLFGCVESQNTSKSSPPDTAPSAEQSASDEVLKGYQSALIAVAFHPDGTLEIDTISPRRFAYRGSLLPYSTRAHGMRPEPSHPKHPKAQGVIVPGQDSPLLKQPSQPIAPTNPHDIPAGHAGHTHPGPSGEAAIVVRAPNHETVVVPIDIGVPGPMVGDVANHWNDGASILRAPYFGPETRYTILRPGNATNDPIVLADAKGNF